MEWLNRWVLMLIVYAIGMTAYNVALRNNNIILMNDLNVAKCCLDGNITAYQKLDSQIAHGLCLQKL
jgi:hypothetical protein